MAIRWEKSDEFAVNAYSGSLCLGHVVGPVTGTTDRYVWSITAVHRITGVVAVRGEVGSMQQGKRSFARAWNKWLSIAGLKES